jgi:amino acid transporter
MVSFANTGLPTEQTFRITNSPNRKANGHTLDELPYQASFGVYGSYICVLINAVALVAQFYVALYPIGGPNLDTQTFFQLYLAGPLLIILYCGWKLYSWFKRPADRPLFIKLKDIDIYTGMREGQFAISGDGVTPAARRASIEELQAAKKKKTPKDYAMGVVRSIF